VDHEPLYPLAIKENLLTDMKCYNLENWLWSPEYR
jgi:hypothetical protein